MAEDGDRDERIAPRAAVLGAALNDPANPDVRDYLRAQTRLADLQSEDLKREDKLRHWSLRVRHVSDVLKLGFEMAVGNADAVGTVGKRHGAGDFSFQLDFLAQV